MNPSARADIELASCSSGVRARAVFATSIEVPDTSTVSSPTAIELETELDSLTAELSVLGAVVPEDGASGLEVTVLTTTEGELVVAALSVLASASSEGAMKAYAHSLPDSPNPLQEEHRSIPGVSFAAASATSFALAFRSSTFALRSTSTVGS